MELSDLNQHFGSAGRIVFREGPGNHPIAVLVAPQGVCEVSLYGGQVLSYRVLGFQDTLWLSPLAEFEDGKAIRGGIPICWPWFGKAPEGMPSGTPSHGFARRSLWRVVNTEIASQETILTLELTDSEATDPAWPYAYRLTLTITLSDCLTLELQTRNLSDETIVYGEALHTYLRVGDARNIRLLGITDEPLTFTDTETHDHVYPKTDLVAIISDPDMERLLAITADDTSAVVVWHPALDCDLSDVSLGGPRHFLCVEPANPHHVNGQITLNPGEAHVITMRLQPTPPNSAN
ncbi:MAG: D-hexose-6-phosphate mutarotase [Kiritimatiellae bacterium]|nr:D-hexose-6-phosphate mutarotase [Kiritimatiellia bacterium]